jgi:hypothetical protein
MEMRNPEARTHVAARCGERARAGGGLLRTALALSLLAAASGSERSAAATPRAELGTRVTEARRSLRQACRASERLLTARPEERTALELSARKDVAAALDRWTSLVTDFGTAAPPGYSSDPAWGRRLEEVRLDLARMRDEVEGCDFRGAILSCRRATSALGALNEAGGVVLAIDSVAALRRKTGYVRGIVLAGRSEQVPSLVAGLLAARDAVLAAPPPPGPSRRAYLRLLPELNRRVEAVVVAAERPGGDLFGPIERLRDLVEELYDRAI